MKKFVLSLILTLTLVLGSSLLTWRTTGLSYNTFTWAAYAGGVGLMYPGNEDDEPGGCSDGEDNDGDDLVDCADRMDCADEIVCQRPAPVMSTGGMVAMMALLMLVGFWGTLRRRTE